MATKTPRLVPLGFLFCEPVVPGEKSEEVWGDSLVSVYQPE